jgi:hypothetical protein
VSNAQSATWDRPHFTPGGDDALVAFLVFGRFDQPLRLSRAKYRSEGVPNSVHVVHHARVRQPEVFESLLTGYIADSLRSDYPDLLDRVQDAPACVRVQGTIPEPRSLDYLRDVVGVVTAFTDQGGVAVLDLLALRWWPPEAWNREVFGPAAPVPRHHVSILVSEDDGPRRWFHTRGMRKFGRPDISVRNVPHEGEAAIIDLCNRLIEQMAFGALIPEGQEIRMRSLPDGMRCRHAGSHDDPDFNNVHIDISYPHQ